MHGFYYEFLAIFSVLLHHNPSLFTFFWGGSISVDLFYDNSTVESKEIIAIISVLPAKVLTFPH